ncbi:MAG: hypothetical protein MRJ93_09630 [Nitrososphaeraceae archaeon]|nr:hypothetical protein [Nitrososphaeraceae archaeon]
MYNVLMIILIGRLAGNMLYTWFSGMLAVVKHVANSPRMEQVLIIICSPFQNIQASICITGSPHSIFINTKT